MPIAKVLQRARRALLSVALVAAGCASSTAKPGSPPVAAPTASPPDQPPAATSPSPSYAMMPGPFQLTSTCDGTCPVGLSLLASERALAIWNTPDASWVQRFDLARCSSLGPPHPIGQLSQ